MEHAATRGEDAGQAPVPVALRPSGAGETAPDPVLERLDGRIAWYDRTAQRAHRWFKVFKVATLVAAAAIPFLSGVGAVVALPGERVALAAGPVGVGIPVIAGPPQ